MAITSRYRIAPFAVALALDVLLLAAAAPASTFNMVVGPHTVVQNAPVSDCTTKAKSALNSVLQNAASSSDGTEWFAYGAPDTSGHTSAAAAIHCFAVGSGYLVTITCSAEVPPSPDTATGLCSKLGALFGIGKGA